MRVTQKHLEAKLDWLNNLTGMPTASYTRNAKGKLTANIGNYHLYHVHGGMALHQMMNESGGIRDVFPGLHTKRELAELIDAYIMGVKSHG